MAAHHRLSCTSSFPIEEVCFIPPHVVETLSHKFWFTPLTSFFPCPFESCACCAAFVGACSPRSKPTAEMVLHDVWSYTFFGWGGGDSAFSPCRSVTQGKRIPPPFPFPPSGNVHLHLHFLCIHPSPHQPGLICFTPPFLSFAFRFIFHSPIQSWSFRFINRSYTPHLLILSINSCFFSLSISLLPCRVSAGSWTGTVLPLFSPPC